MDIAYAPGHTTSDTPFAVSTLLDWHHAGVEVDRELPLLTTYLGHQDPANTYWYLQATPELLTLVAKRLDGLRENGHERARPDTRGVLLAASDRPSETRVPALSPRIATPGGCRCGFASEQTGKQPCQLDIADLDAPLIGAFLDHLEAERGNSPRTRNARLAAIHSFYRFASLRHPEHAQTIARVIEIPPKRLNRPLISYLDEHEIKALLAAPDRTSWLGRRDHALLLVAIQTGLRVSELTTLRNRDISLGAGAHARVTGKGRRNVARCSPPKPSRYCAYGAANAEASLTILCFRRDARPVTSSRLSRG